MKTPLPFYPCLCITALLLTACDDKKPALVVPKPEAAKSHNYKDMPPPRPEVPKIPGPQEDDPLTWPLELKVGKDGRLVPPATSSLTPRDQKRDWLNMVLNTIRPQGHYIIRKGPVKLTPSTGGGSSGGGRQPFKNIDHAPAKQKGGGVDSDTHQVYQDGFRKEIDQDTGIETTFGDDGSITTLDPNNNTLHVVEPDGTTTDIDAQNGDLSVKHPDGSSDHYDKDGGGSHLYGPGGGPDGELGYSYGPDGPTGDRRIQHDGGSVDQPGPGGPLGSSAPPDGSKLKDGSGPGGDRMASGAGEPHYLTRDGTGYTTQAVGEFMLVTGKPGREVQVRQQPWKGSESISAITAMGFLVGESTIEVRLDGTVLLGEYSAPEGPMVRGDIPGGGAIGIWRKEAKLVSAVIVWPDLSTVWITVRNGWLDFHLQWNDLAPEHRGLLGSNDDNAANDLMDRSGTVASVLDDAAVATFVDSWRITDDESIFTYAEGQSTATYTQRDFPRVPATPKYKALAEECCGGLPEGFAKQQCIYDVSMTGERQFAVSYQDLAKRHSAVAGHATIIQAAMKKTVKTPTSDAALLTEAERKDAKEIDSNAMIKETLKAGESRVYRFLFDNTNRPQLGLLSEELAPGQKYNPETPGYALFNNEGKLIGSITAAGSDYPMTDLDKGTYYLKIYGPGLVHIKLH